LRSGPAGRLAAPGSRRARERAGAGVRVNSAAGAAGAAVTAAGVVAGAAAAVGAGAGAAAALGEAAAAGGGASAAAGAGAAGAAAAGGAAALAPVAVKAVRVASCVARCAPMLEDTLLNNAARAVYSNVLIPGEGSFGLLAWLPAYVTTAVQRSETLVVIALRESIVILTLVALFAVTPHICRALNWLWGSVVMRDNGVTEEDFQDSVFGALVLPLQFVAAAFFLTRHMRLLLPLAKLHLSPYLLRRFRLVSVVVAVTCFAVGWKDRVMRMVFERHPEEKPILLNVSRFLSLLIHLVGVGTVLDLFGVSLLSLVAVGGISGVAMGFASKEIVTNFFGGLVLFISQPFVVGERIQAGAISGQVVEIGFLHTKLAGADKAPVVVPNQIFNTAVITNFSRAKCYPLKATFELRIEDIVRVRTITTRITDMLRSHADVDQSQGPAHAVLKDLCGASLHVGMLASLNPQQDGRNVLEVKQEILERAVGIVLDEGGFIGANMPFLAVDLDSLRLASTEGNGASS
ncbi:hypothetical protein CLOM_g1814, partial [Closterium sp. NIES-68]